MERLRERVDRLEKLIIDYIEKDRQKLIEERDELRNELRASKTATTKLRNELLRRQERRKILTERAKEILKSE